MAVVDLDCLFHHIDGSYAGNVFTYDTTRKTGLIRRRPLPKKKTIATPAQKAWRAIYRDCVMLWVAKSAEQKQLWKNAINHSGISGYDVFMSTALRKKRDGEEIPETPPPGAGCKPPCPRPGKAPKDDPPREPSPPPDDCSDDFFDDFDRISDELNDSWQQFIESEGPIKSDGDAYVFSGLGKLNICKAFFRDPFCTSDVWVEAPQNATGDAPQNHCGLAARVDNPDEAHPDHYLLMWYPGVPPELYKAVDSVYTLLDTGDDVAGDPMQLVVHAAVQHGKFGGALAVRAYDNTISEGHYAGFYLGNNGFFRRSHLEDFHCYTRDFVLP